MTRPETTFQAARTPDAGPGPETPSGKGAGDENFPVGSFLIAKALRPHVAAFYAFARAADDIADNKALEPQDKITRLEAFEAALTGEPGHDAGFEKAHGLRTSLQACNVTDKHARDLLAAFRQDATKLRYANWRELLGYCELSANPVGRYLLDLHGEDRAAWVYSDALCTVLQILNHMQDCGNDYRDLHRVYVPCDWMDIEGVSTTDLAHDRLEPGMRRVFDRMLREIEILLETADDLPRVLKDRRLAMESAVIVRLAHRLSGLLRQGDPLATRVALAKLDFAFCGLAGVLQGLFGTKKKP